MAEDGSSYFAETYQQWAVRNEKTDFLGMQTYLPLIDGAIALNKLKGNDNMVDYLQEVWKDNIIGGKKQKAFKGVWDWSLNKLVDITTLGYIGLDSSVVLGNTIMGKYTNLRAKGGQEFVKGEKSSGTGLGLNIVRKVLYDMGGELKFSKNPTKFELSIPWKVRKVKTKLSKG